MMSDKKYVVPEGMLKAALDSARQTVQGCPWQELATKAVEAALLWQSENPTVPTEEQMDALFSRHSWLDKDSVRFGAREWQRQMFLAPEPEVPEEINDLLMGPAYTSMTGMVELNHEWDKRIIEAYRRGRSSR